MTLIELECKLSNSLMTYDEFLTGLWSMCVSKDAAQMRQFAKELNVYPKGERVYTAILNYFFSNIAI